MRSLVGIIFTVRAFAQVPAPPAHPLTDQAWSIISDALGDKNPDTRVQAVQSMGLIGVHEPYISTLEAMLDDKDVEVRVATVTSLVDLKNPKTVPALKKALGDPIPEVSFAAAKALWTLKDEDGEDALLSVLSGEAESVVEIPGQEKARDAPHVPHAETADVFRDQDWAASRSRRCRDWGRAFRRCRESFWIPRCPGARRRPYCWPRTKIRACWRPCSTPCRIKKDRCGRRRATPSRCATIENWRIIWFRFSTIKRSRRSCGRRRDICGWNRCQRR